MADSVFTKLRGFIEKQQMFFVATAPLSDQGHVNVSPKGLDGTFAVLDEHTVAVEDFEIVTLPDANHLFQASETGAMEEYPELEPVFTADFLPTLVDWVVERTGVAE